MKKKKEMINLGVDIHIHIVENNKIIKKDIFDGRNYDWFDKLQGGYNELQREYNYLKISQGFSTQTPKSIIEKYSEKFYYGHRHIKVKDFNEWFIKYRPDLDAGWVTTYDKWLIERKGVSISEIEYYKELPEDANINDMHFIEFECPYDCSKWLYEYLINNNIDENADIIYCFDC